MTAAYRIAPRARLDLDEIWRYIAADRLVAADELLDAMQAKFALLASQPYLGESRPELGADLRSSRVGNYAIFYRVVEGDVVVEIIRVLHGARDIGAAMS